MQTYLCFKKNVRLGKQFGCGVCANQDFVFNVHDLTHTKVIKAKWWWCTSLVLGLEYL